MTIENEKGEANNKFARTYIMEKEFYNLNLIMTEIQNDKDEKYFRYTLPFTEYE